jgi:AraC-like DNA-binding protein
MADALTDILDSIRMRGSIFSRAALDAPWGVESGPMSTGIFHAVVRGRAWAQLAEGGQPVELERGDVVLMPFGDNHLMTDAPNRITRPITELTSLDERGMGQLVVDGDGSHTSLICGTFAFDKAGAHPVFSVLPRLITVSDVDGRAARLIEDIIRLIADEVDNPVPGSETVVARLTDVLIVYVLRNYINSLSEGEGGWLSGLKDPQVADALGLIHRRPEHPWTVDELAESVGLSRSALHGRFRATVGETPATYLTRWRVHLATRLLTEEGRSVAAASRMVGYGTEASFSNAFVRVMGIRPGAYKQSREPVGV